MMFESGLRCTRVFTQIRRSVLLDLKVQREYTLIEEGVGSSGVERRTENPSVGGSIPPLPTILRREGS